MNRIGMFAAIMLASCFLGSSLLTRSFAQSARDKSVGIEVSSSRPSPGYQFMFKGKVTPLEEIETVAGENLILAVDASTLVYAFDSDSEFHAWAKQSAYKGSVDKIEQMRIKEAQDSSSGDTGAGAANSLVLGFFFDNTNLSGQMLPVWPGWCRNMGWYRYDNKASSVIIAGVTVLWDKTYYTGRRVWFFAPIYVFNLADFNFDNTASSFMSA